MKERPGFETLVSFTVLNLLNRSSRVLEKPAGAIR